jgi:large subunit ribosomal protein L10
MESTAREPRPAKVAVVDEVRVRLSTSSAAILTEYRGLAVSDMTELRRALTKAGGEYKVYKNTLVRLASADLGLAELDAMLTGPTAIAFVDGDVAAVAKVLRDFARTNPNLVVKGGLLGTSMLDARSAAALAELPSREALLAQIAGMFAAPMRQFAALVQAVPAKLAYGLSALIDERRKTEPVEATPEPEAATPTPAADEVVEDAAPAEDAAPEPVATAEAAPAEDAAPAAEAVVEVAPEAEAAEAAPVAEAAPEAELAAEEATPEAEESPAEVAEDASTPSAPEGEASSD